MKNPHSIDRLAASSARQAQSQHAQLQHELRALRDNRAGLSHSLKVPKLNAKRTKTKKTTTPSALNDILGGANLLSGGGLASGLGLAQSFYISGAQVAVQNLNMLNLAQRNK